MGTDVISDRPLLIIITGAPATGKTTLGRKLGEQFALPFFSKDDFKGALFESLGWSDAAWSRKVGAASITLLRTVARAELTAGRSLIVESNFRPAYDNEHFGQLVRTVTCEPFQIFCDAAPATLIERYQARWRSGARHPGLVEHGLIDSFAADHLDGSYAPLVIGGTLHTLDTTDFSALDLTTLLSAIRDALGASQPHAERDGL